MSEQLAERNELAKRIARAIGEPGMADIIASHLPAARDVANNELAERVAADIQQRFVPELTAIKILHTRCQIAAMIAPYLPAQARDVYYEVECHACNAGIEASEGRGDRALTIQSLLSEFLQRHRGHDLEFSFKSAPPSAAQPVAFG